MVISKVRLAASTVEINQWTLINKIAKWVILAVKEGTIRSIRFDQAQMTLSMNDTEHQPFESRHGLANKGVDKTSC